MCIDHVNCPTITCYFIISNDSDFKNKRENGASVTETKGIHKEMQFLITNIGKEDILLGYPWLADPQPPQELPAGGRRVRVRCAAAAAAARV